MLAILKNRGKPLVGEKQRVSMEPGEQQSALRSYGGNQFWLASDSHSARQLSAFIGMLTLNEKLFLYNYGRKAFTAEGVIADLGCFVGASTCSLALGLSANPRLAAITQPLHSFDLFLWDKQMHSFFKQPLSRVYQEGDPFFEEFRERTAQFAPLITPYRGDIAEIGWSSKQPIECLFVDVMKNWAVCEAVTRDFFPCLIPGKSLLVHQDFCHFYTYWIHLQTYALRDCFAPELAISESSILVFRCIRSVSEDQAVNASRLSSFSLDDLEAAIEYSLSLVDEPRQRSEILAARIRGLIDFGELNKAAREMARMENLLETRAISCLRGMIKGKTAAAGCE